MLVSKTRGILSSIAFVACVLTAASSFADEVKIPQTAAEHEASAKSYTNEATQFRQSADEHRQMAAEYAKQHPDLKGVGKNPWNQKMQKHCMALAKDFDKLADDAQKAADFQALRAKEMQGQ